MMAVEDIFIVQFVDGQRTTVI